MSTITTLASGDNGSTSRGVINTNFSNLNTDKLEASYLDTDGTLAANSDMKVATQRAVKTYVDAEAGNAVTIETTAGATHALTTTAGQRVVVWAKGTVATPGGDAATDYSVYLKYNGVTKDTVVQNSGAAKRGSFALMYTEIPGAATQNITVTTTGDSVSNVVIIVMKIA